MYQYRATVIRVIDGDSIVLDVDLGFRMSTEQSFRLAGIDTPELRSRDPAERAAAQRAKRFLEELCPRGSQIEIATAKAGKFGRWLAWLLPIGESDLSRSFNEALLSEGHAKSYSGGRR